MGVDPRMIAVIQIGRTGWGSRGSPGARIRCVQMEMDSHFVLATRQHGPGAANSAPSSTRRRRCRARRDTVFLSIGGGAQKALIAARGGRARPRQPAVRRRNPTSRATAWHQSLGAADAHLVSLRPELEGLVVPSGDFYGIAAAAARPALFIGNPEGEIGAEDSRRGLRAVRAPGRRGGARRGDPRRCGIARTLRERMGRNGAPHVRRSGTTSRSPSSAGSALLRAVGEGRPDRTGAQMGMRLGG